MRIFLDKKSGFTTTDKLVVVNDARGQIFYYKENTDGLLHFNLPEGEYTHDNNLTPAKPRNYQLKWLPKGNRIKPLPPNGFTIVFEENPNKCSVDSDTHTIYFDNSFKTAPQPIIDFIKAHELGHYFYSGQGQRSERLCDLFAYNTLLDYGYNPSQIWHAQKISLSDSEKAQVRKNEIYQQANKNFSK